MREHSRLAQRNLRLALSGQGGAQMPESMKAMKLIRRRG
jgi:GntR family transcriptional regulator, vanillate catabolism transcriptional regulator